MLLFFFFQAEDGIRDLTVTGVQTCALPILRTVVTRDGDLAATNRNGEIGVADDRGRERERYPVVYGAKIKVKADQRIKSRTVLVEWDPFTNPILTEFTGRVEYQDIIEGVTVREEFEIGRASCRERV